MTAGIQVLVLGFLFKEFLLIISILCLTKDAFSAFIFSQEIFADGRVLADVNEGVINDFSIVVGYNEVAVTFNWDSFLSVTMNGLTFFS